MQLPEFKIVEKSKTYLNELSNLDQNGNATTNEITININASTHTQKKATKNCLKILNQHVEIDSLSNKNKVIKLSFNIIHPTFSILLRHLAKEKFMIACIPELSGDLNKIIKVNLSLHFIKESPKRKIKFA